MQHARFIAPAVVSRSACAALTDLAAGRRAAELLAEWHPRWVNE